MSAPDNWIVADECRRSIELARLGYLLANGKLDRYDANTVIHECQPLAGWFPLETLSVESTVDLAREYWHDHPAIPDLAAQACRRVWNKWSSGGEITGAAEDWAIDLITEYAAEDDINLVRVDEEATA